MPESGTDPTERIPMGVNRILMRGPSYNAALCARLTGPVDPEAWGPALQRLARKHRMLAARIALDQKQRAWVDFDPSPEIRVMVEPRQGEDHWKMRVLEENRIPFRFEEGPLFRVILLLDESCSPPVTDVILYAQHAVCDGLSKIYILRDLLACLQEPSREISPEPPPLPYSWKNIPGIRLPNFVFRTLVKPLNVWWSSRRIHFDQGDQQKLHAAFQRIPLSIHTWTLEGAELRQFLVRCREQGVTVNSAIVAALLKAREEVFGEGGRYLVPVNIRDRVQPSPGEVMGFYSASLSGSGAGLAGCPWNERVERVHRTIQAELASNRFITPPFLEHLHPSLLDALIFHQYSLFDNALIRWVARLLKWDKPPVAFEVSNLGRLRGETGKEFPVQVEAVFGPVIHMPQAEIFVGVATVGEVMTQTLTYRQDRFTPEQVRALAGAAREWIRGCGADTPPAGRTQGAGD